MAGSSYRGLTGRGKMGQNNILFNRQKILTKIEESAKSFVVSVKEEASNTKEAGLIIQKYLQTKEITKDEEHTLRTQLYDSLKIVGVVIPFILIPGASIIMPILIKIAEKHDIELLPTSFQKKKKKKENVSA